MLEQIAATLALRGWQVWVDATNEDPHPFFINACAKKAAYVSTTFDDVVVSHVSPAMGEKWVPGSLHDVDVRRDLEPVYETLVSTGLL